MPTKPYDEWKKAVDQAVVKKIGIHVDDLPDLCPLAVWHAEGMTPSRAAREVIKECRPGNW